jgi:LacI family transcriptional regulator
MSIIGCDDTLISEISSPKLTTINLHMKEVGERAARELLNLIDGNDQDEKLIKIQTNLVIRDSCSKVK